MRSFLARFSSSERGRGTRGGVGPAKAGLLRSDRFLLAFVCLTSSRWVGNVGKFSIFTSNEKKLLFLCLIDDEGEQELTPPSRFSMMSITSACARASCVAFFN